MREEKLKKKGKTNHKDTDERRNKKKFSERK